MESRVLAYSASVNCFGGPSVLSNSRSCTNHFSEGSVYTGRLTSWRIPQCFMGCYAQSLLIERSPDYSVLVLFGRKRSPFFAVDYKALGRVFFIPPPFCLAPGFIYCDTPIRDIISSVVCNISNGKCSKFLATLVTHQARSPFRDNKVAFQPRT